MQVQSGGTLQIGSGSTVNVGVAGSCQGSLGGAPSGQAPPSSPPTQGEVDAVAAMCDSGHSTIQMRVYAEHLFGKAGPNPLDYATTIDEVGCGTNSAGQRGFWVHFTAGPNFYPALHFRPADISSNASVSMAWVAQSARNPHACSDGSWSPMNGPGFDGGLASYSYGGYSMESCVSGYTCNTGSAERDRDEPISASFSTSGFDSATSLLSWHITVYGGVVDCTECLCSNQIPTAHSGVWFTQLSYTASYNPPPPPLSPTPAGPVSVVFDGGMNSCLTQPAAGSIEKSQDSGCTTGSGYVSAWTTATVTPSRHNVLRFQCATSSTSLGQGWKMIGFKSGPLPASASARDASGDSYNWVDYGITCAGSRLGNNAFIHYGNNYEHKAISQASPYTTSMVFEIRLTSAGVEWYVNDVLVHSEATTLSYPLHVDATIYNVQQEALFNIMW